MYHFSSKFICEDSFHFISGWNLMPNIIKRGLISVNKNIRNHRIVKTKVKLLLYSAPDLSTAASGWLFFSFLLIMPAPLPLFLLSSLGFWSLQVWTMAKEKNVKEQKRFIWLQFMKILVSSSFGKYLKLTLTGDFVGLGLHQWTLATTCLWFNN